MINKENKPEVQEVLEALRWRLENKLAANQQLSLNRPSLRGYCNGLEDALKELELIENAAFKNQAEIPAFSLPVLESTTSIGHGVTLECWFIRTGVHITRSEVYHLEDGSVVAYQDTVDGQSGLLHMDMAFKALHAGEEDFDMILKYAGVLDPDKIPVFYTGR